MAQRSASVVITCRLASTYACCPAGVLEPEVSLGQLAYLVPKRTGRQPVLYPCIGLSLESHMLKKDRYGTYRRCMHAGCFRMCGGNAQVRTRSSLKLEAWVEVEDGRIRVSCCD
jgi:hypothetical protein